MRFVKSLRAGLAALVIGSLACGLAGCSGGAAESKLPVKEVSVSTPQGLHHFKVEIASDEPSREHGLMNRTHLAADAGMLFVYPKAQIVAFWMKNTPLPLDMLYIRDDGTIANIFQSVTPFSEKPLPSMEPIRAVLELNGGRAEALGIEPGDHVYGGIFPKPGDKR